ncbi:MAG: CinA family protein [Beijerinckiaceae bacterium]
MQTLVPIAEKIAELLRARGETLAVAESSAGGLISAALLAVPGASAYFLGGAIVYTMNARTGLMGISAADMEGMRASTEDYAMMLAEEASDRLASDWAIAETGATGPTGNRYGDAAGHCCIAVCGPYNISLTIETGSADRQANMRTFAAKALETMLDALLTMGNAIDG